MALESERPGFEFQLNHSQVTCSGALSLASVSLGAPASQMGMRGVPSHSIPRFRAKRISLGKTPSTESGSEDLAAIPVVVLLPSMLRALSTPQPSLPGYPGSPEALPHHVWPAV